MPVETYAQAANTLKHLQDLYLVGNKLFGPFSLEKQRVLQTLIDKSKQDIRKKKEDLHNFSAVFNPYGAHSGQLFANVFNGARDKINNIYKQLYGSADYTAEMLGNLQDGWPANNISVSFTGPMARSFHIFNSEESLMAAISLILAIVENEKWPILIIDLIGANLKLENAKRVVEYVNRFLLTPGIVQQIVICTDRQEVVNDMNSEKKNYLTSSNDFVSIMWTIEYKRIELLY